MCLGFNFWFFSISAGACGVVLGEVSSFFLVVEKGWLNLISIFIFFCSIMKRLMLAWNCLWYFAMNFWGPGNGEITGALTVGLNQCNGELA